MNVFSYIKTITSRPVELWSSANTGQSMVRAFSMQADTANVSGNVYVGGANVTSGIGQQIVSEGVVEYRGDNDNIDLTKWFVTGTLDDTVRVLTVVGG